MSTEKGLNYSDVYLIPRYSELKSRSEADISVEFLGRKFRAPWLPANMASVISEENAKWLSENDYFYIYHRFGESKFTENGVIDESTRGFVDKANKENWKLISISVGVKQEDKDLLYKITKDPDLRVDIITIDIAHGHSLLMKEMIEFIRDLKFGFNLKNYYDNTYRPKIIAGNVCTPEAVGDLARWGADAVKVGIAGGGACSTKNMTGFHIPMFSCVEECSNWKEIFLTKELTSEEISKILKLNIPIIADGGIRENGDIAKALVVGGTMVMAGSIFAACTDAPGENIYQEIGTGKGTNLFINEHGRTESGIWREEKIKKLVKKRYYGSASAKQKGEKKNVEGFEVELPCNGLTYAEKYQELTESLQSSVSYGGGKNLSCFKDVKWITVK